jgi:hypothetical protein
LVSQTVGLAKTKDSKLNAKLEAIG